MGEKERVERIDFGGKELEEAERPLRSWENQVELQPRDPAATEQLRSPASRLAGSRGSLCSLLQA